MLTELVTSFHVLSTFSLCYFVVINTNYQTFSAFSSKRHQYSRALLFHAANQLKKSFIPNNNHQLRLVPSHKQHFPHTTSTHMSEVSSFLEQNGLGMYSCIMDDQGFDELADLIALMEDDASFKDLVPALGHRTKIRRLLLAGGSSQPTSTPISLTTPVTSSNLLPTLSTLPSLPPVISELALRPTPLVAWLDENQLEIYAASLQRAGYDNIADMTELLKTPELFEHLIPIVGHRDRIRRLLGPTATPGRASTTLAEQWLGGIKTPAPGPDPELASSHGGGALDTTSPGFLGETDAVSKLLSAVGSNFITRGKTMSPAPPTQYAPQEFEEPDESSDASSSSHPQQYAPPPKRVSGGSNSNSRGDSSNGITIGEGTYAFDTAVFVDNEGLDSARRRGNGVLCKRNTCDAIRCRDLHFREVNVKHEHMKRPCSCAYVSQVTLGLLTALRKGDRVTACNEDGCNSTSCLNAHIGFPLRREVSHNSGTIIELGNYAVPLRDCSFTDALVRLMDRPVTQLDKKYQQNARICPAFALSQVCPKGVRCWNYHVLPSNFSRFFWKAFPLDRLNRHLNSLNHLHSEQYDVAQRMERTGRRSFEVGEALDIMVHTTCRPCALIFFEAFRSGSRRQGSDLLWALMHRMHSYQGREDSLMNELMVSANNILQLRHSETLSSTTSLEQLVTRMSEAIVQNLKKSMDRGFPADAGRPRNAFVFWDFDNILFAERNDLTLFYQCMMTYLTREGFASNKSAVHVKAFGTQHSFATETVDALRDMQVEMVLCSSKKQEETDRQMERSMRSLEGRTDCTVVILSSDKDFASIAKELTRTGVHVVILHCADESSNHDSMLQMSSSESRHIFEVYASALKTSKPQPRRMPEQQQIKPQAAQHYHHDATMEVFSSRTSPQMMVSDPAIIASHGVVSSSGSPGQQSGGNIMSFFKSSPSPSLPRAPSEVMDASALEQALLKSSANKGPSVPQPRSVQNGTNGTSIATLKPDDKGFNVASLFAKLSTSAGSTASARLTPPPAPVIVPLVSLAQTPLPPKDHRSWYALFVDAFLVRLQDRQRAGDLRGPYNPNASEESVRREMRVFTEMAGMVTGFLPEWFRFDAATRMMYHKIMDDSPDDWMNNEHFLSTYDASQFIEVFVVLRYIAAVVEGPLAGHDEYCSPPSVTLRLKRSS